MIDQMTVYRFQSRVCAFSFADHCHKAHAVMLGEACFLVVSLADAARLERVGYEWA